METGIRPLTLGEILDRTALLYRTNFLLFAGIFAVYAGLLMILNLVQIGVTSWFDFAHAGLAIKVALFGALAVKIFVIIAGAGVTTAAINRAVAWVHLGQRATISSSFKSILPKSGRYIWLTFIMYVIIGGPLVLGLVAGGVFLARTPGFLAGQIDTSNKGTMLAYVAIFGGFGLFFLGWLVYSTLMGLRYSLSVPSSVMEDLKAWASIKRSVYLSKGSRGRIFVLLLLALAIEIGFSMISQLFIFILAFKHHGQIGPVAQSVSQIIAFFTNAFLGPIYATGLTLFYYDQRVRKEGFDIEWMMLSAGMTTSADTGDASIMPAPPAPESLSGTESTHE
jgi:hypothetical protein